MTVEPLDDVDFRFMWRIWAAWQRDRPATSGDSFLDQYLNRFQLAEPQMLDHGNTLKTDELDLSAQVGWLAGRPLQRSAGPIVPIANMQYSFDPSGELKRLSVRVALLKLRSDDTVHADGWRFELAETPTETKPHPSHPYHHAQAVIGWRIGTTCLMHPHHEAGDVCSGIDLAGEPLVDEDRAASRGMTNQSHPAFPLHTRTITGLCAIVLTTLYGAEVTKSILAADEVLKRIERNAIWEDLDALHAI